jgi:predicted DCC family thiol-disulfide oxidoreductase YuxK
MKVIYDGSCPVCNSLKDFALKRDSNHQLDFVPYQVEDYAEQVSGLTQREASRSLYAIMENKEQLRGARAVFAAMGNLPRLWGAAGKTFSQPPFVWIAEPIYRLFARHRHGVSRWF